MGCDFKFLLTAFLAGVLCVERMIVQRITFERQSVMDHRALIIRCCGYQSCTMPNKRRKKVIKKKRKRTTKNGVGTTVSAGATVEGAETTETKVGEETTEGGDTTVEDTTADAGETTAEEETTDASSEEPTTESENSTTLEANSTISENATTFNPNSTLHPNATTLNPNATTLLPNMTLSGNMTNSTLPMNTTTMALNTTTMPTTPPLPPTPPPVDCSATSCLNISCSEVNQYPSTSELLVLDVLRGNPIPSTMIFTTQEICNKIYKVIGGSAIGDYEDAVRVCCLLNMKPVMLDSVDKMNCISNMLRTLNNTEPWYVWTSARQKNCFGPYFWCPGGTSQVNDPLWAPGFPTKYNFSMESNIAPRCTSINIVYPNSTTSNTTFKNSACDYLNTILCEPY